MNSAKYNIGIRPSFSGSMSNVGTRPGSMCGLGKVDYLDWARLYGWIGPGSMLVLGLAFLDVGPMLALGQVQCEDWARINMKIGPGPMFTLNWHTLVILQPGGGGG